MRVSLASSERSPFHFSAPSASRGGYRSPALSDPLARHRASAHRPRRRPDESGLWRTLTSGRCRPASRHAPRPSLRNGAVTSRAVPQLDRRQLAKPLDAVEPRPIVSAHLSRCHCRALSSGVLPAAATRRARSGSIYRLRFRRTRGSHLLFSVGPGAGPGFATRPDRPRTSAPVCRCNHQSPSQAVRAGARRHAAAWAVGWTDLPYARRGRAAHATSAGAARSPPSRPARGVASSDRGQKSARSICAPTRRAPATRRARPRQFAFSTSQQARRELR